MSTTRILVVDDETAYTRMVKHALEDSGDFEVKVENNPTKALETAHYFNPDVVVLDIIMPEMSGLEVAEQFKKDSAMKDKAIIFLSAAVSRERPQINHDLLADCRVLVKPVGSDDLIACISESQAA